MESDAITIRLPRPLRAACQRLADAAGITLREWLRSLAERETGVSVEMRPGLAGASKRKRKEVSRMGVEARQDQTA